MQCQGLQMVTSFNPSCVHCPVLTVDFGSGDALHVRILSGIWLIGNNIFYDFEGVVLSLLIFPVCDDKLTAVKDYYGRLWNFI